MARQQCPLLWYACLGLERRQSSAKHVIISLACFCCGLASGGKAWEINDYLLGLPAGRRPRPGQRWVEPTAVLQHPPGGGAAHRLVVRPSATACQQLKPRQGMGRSIELGLCD